MSHTCKSSKRGGKRAKKQLLAAINATTREENLGVNISDSSLNLSQPAQSPNNGSAPNERPPKKGRGKAKMLNIPEGKQLEIEFNERGQPIGLNSPKYSSLLGVTVKEIVPITMKWEDVTDIIKERLWTCVKSRFIVDDCRKDDAIAKMAKIWSEYKSRIRKIMKRAPAGNTPIRPDNVKSNEDWNLLVKNCCSEEFKKKSTKFRAMRANQTMPHTTSRKGYARLEAEMKLKSEQPNSVTRVDVWIKGHLKKNGDPPNDEVENYGAR